MIGVLLRTYSYLYHVALSVLVLAVSLVAIFSRSHTLKLDMLPWKGKQLTYWLLAAALSGLVSILLAWVGKLRLLFLLYTLAVVSLMFRGYFLGGYTFRGKDEFHLAIWLTAGALLAVLGAWSQLRRKPRKRRR